MGGGCLRYAHGKLSDDRKIRRLGYGFPNGGSEDNGDVYGNYTGYPVNHPFIYSYKNDKAYELGYIMKLAHPDFEAAGNFGSGSEACFINVSNDGSRFAGNTSSWSGSGFVMEMEPCEVEIPDTPNISYGFSRAMNSVTLRWNAGQTMYSRNAA